LEGHHEAAVPRDPCHTTHLQPLHGIDELLSRNPPGKKILPWDIEKWIGIPGI